MGTGLGLAICKGIIEGHGGRIWLDKDYRVGAAIKLTLPESVSKIDNATQSNHE